jgi:LmbE family N-acetylglucosaminyl deacetylase
METTEDWQGIKEILVILAHPDDPEFFLGGTIARWVAERHTVRYVLLTKGEKGAVDQSISPGELSVLRVQEQNDAANVLGVKSVEFLDYFDGEILPDLEMRQQIVRAIRKYRPNILVTCDPGLLFPRIDSINHPDHRYTGLVVLDAVFPAAGNRLYFPQLLEEGLLPHEVDEVWLSLTGRPNVLLDVTKYWQKKISALRCHKSQIVDLDRFEQKRIEKLNLAPKQPFKVEEKFHRINFRRSPQ